MSSATLSTANTVMTREQAINTLANYTGQYLKQKNIEQNITTFAKTKFYIPETEQPLKLERHQASILNYVFDPDQPYQYGGTFIYSTVKKSGKTSVASLVGRWIAETWGKSNEIYTLANDLEQARGRIYDKILKSIELDPNYVKSRQYASLGWKIIERQAVFEPTGSIVKALSGDYRGEAGSNPTATLWSELWAYTSEASRRLWEELVPVPTRKRAIRMVETYAGFEDESTLLLDLYKLGLRGRRLTHDDIDWPFNDQPPIWVNERARLFMYWDSGEVARRMPWQTPDYYAKEAETTTRQNSFDRLHLNLWTSSVDSFIPIEWWEANRTRLPPLHTNRPDGVTEYDNNTPIVLGVDAAVSNDCFAITGTSRDPNQTSQPLLRFYDVFYPPPGGQIDFTTADQLIRLYCERYNIVQIAYDQYQLHKLMMDIRNDGLAWVKPFSQNAQREIADKQLFDLIKTRHMPHNAGPEFTDHVKAAAAKTTGDIDKLRIVKKNGQQHIDLLVALSMSAFECLRLSLD